MPTAPLPRLDRGDLVAVALPPGRAWAPLVARLWEAEAALLPVDHRLPPVAIAALLERARPAVLVDAGGGRRLEGGAPCDPAVAAVVATSGSSGEPRLVELDRAAVAAAVTASAAALGAEPGHRWLSCLTPAHIGGLLVLLRAVVLGCPLTVHDRFDVERVAATRDCDYTSVAATMLVRLLDAGVDLRRFRALVVGGSALTPGLAERAADAGAAIVSTYGLTESCGGVVYDGRPLEGVTVAALAGGRLHTGDAGSLDAAGRLHILGRIAEVIVSGGVKVWPGALEAVLREHPGVADVAVTGAPDREWGERVVAVVVPADPSRPPTLEQLRDHAGARIGRHRAPRELVIVDSLPRTALGKIRRGELRNGGTLES
jgi:O-succinylbenzoic acid--CoA ligase